jgi:hypothetical protein
MTTMPCPSCAGRGLRREGGRFVCAWCGQPVTPRLEPGTLCGDEHEGRPCRALAESLCSGCGRALCTVHNDPDRWHWHEPLSWRSLCPEWSEADAAAWHRVQQPLPSLPLEGFEPFPWVRHDRAAQYALGQLEDEIAAALRPRAKAVGADLDADAVAFEDLCTRCEAELLADLRRQAAAFAPRYRQVACVDRLDAVQRDLDQALRYALAWLDDEPRPAEPARVALPLLGADSPREDWEIWVATLRERLAEAERLRARLTPAG